LTACQSIARKANQPPCACNSSRGEHHARGTLVALTIFALAVAGSAATLRHPSQKGAQALVDGKDVLGEPAIQVPDFVFRHDMTGLRHPGLQLARRVDQLAVRRLVRLDPGESRA
jgi:hypothetical protein